MNGNLMFTKSNLNLLPKNIERKRNTKYFVYYILLFLLVINVSFVIYTSILSSQVHALNTAKANDLKKIEAAKPLLDLDTKIKGNKLDIEKILAYQNSISSIEAPMFEILKDFEVMYPSVITMQSILLSQEGKMTLTGFSKNEFVVVDLVTALKKMDKFSDVYLKSVIKKESKINGIVYINYFEIDCQIKGLEKKDPKAAKAQTTAQSANGGKK